MVSRLLLVGVECGLGTKRGAPQGASTIFLCSRYFFSAFAAGRTGFSLSRCMLM